MKVVVDIPSWPPFAIVCAYLEAGSGLCERNVAHLGAIGKALEQEHLSLCGGGWNLDPSLVESSGVARGL
eukprot:8357924-Pyramimonas_sp.AAC.1